MKNILKFNLVLLIIYYQFVLPQQWQNIGPPGGTVKQIAIDPQNPNNVYATSYWGGALFKSNDGGATSKMLGDTLAQLLGFNILINPIDPNIIYSSEYKSTDGGDTWKKINIGGMVINPKNPNQIFTRRYYGQLWVSNDGGESSYMLYNFKGSLDAIAISHSDTNILYVEAYDTLTGYGIHKSTNSGKNFTKTTFPREIIRDIAINPLNPNVVYVGTFDGNVYKTIDGGISWNLIIQSPPEIINDIDVSIVDSFLVYVVTHHWLLGNSGNVYKSTNAGLAWHTYNNGLPTGGDRDRYISAVTINPTNPEEVYIGTHPFGVFKTTNGGLNWEWTRVMTLGVYTITVDPDSSGYLYCGSAMGIVTTSDDGKTWRFNENIPSGI